MKQLVRGMLVVVLMSGTFLDGVDAQDNIVTEPPGGAPAPAPTAVPAKSYNEYKREELERGARRSRNALIGLSAATIVGTAMLFPGLANQCYAVYNPSTVSDEIRCTSAGKALVGIGSPLFVGGVTGVLITGIMFGVRKGKLRRLNDRMAYEKSRAVRWDPASSRFVF